MAVRQETWETTYAPEFVNRFLTFLNILSVLILYLVAPALVFILFELQGGRWLLALLVAYGLGFLALTSLSLYEALSRSRVAVRLKD